MIAGNCRVGILDCSRHLLRCAVFDELTAGDVSAPEIDHSATEAREETVPLLRDRRFRCYRFRRARWTRHAAAIQDTVRYVPATIYCNNSRSTQILQIIRKQWKKDPTKSADDSRIEYAEPAWSWMCSAADNARLDSLLRRSKRLGYVSTICIVWLLYMGLVA